MYSPIVIALSIFAVVSAVVVMSALAIPPDKPADDQPKHTISFTDLTSYDEGSAEYTATRDFALQKITLILHTCNDNEFWAALKHLEAPALRGVVDPSPQHPVRYTVDYVVGTFAGVDTAVIKTEQGNSGRPALRKALKEDFPHVKLIIGGGIAYSKSSSFGNVLISKQIENFVQAEAVNNERRNIDGERESVGPFVMSLFVTNPSREEWNSKGIFVCSTNNRTSKAIVGCIVSAPTLVRSKNLKNELFKHTPGGIGGEMEGWVLMEVANELKREEGRDIEFIVIKGVADFGDNDKKDDWQFTAAKAAFNYTHYCVKNAGQIPFLSSSEYESTTLFDNGLNTKEAPYVGIIQPGCSQGGYCDASGEKFKVLLNSKKLTMLRLTKLKTADGVINIAERIGSEYDCVGLHLLNDEDGGKIAALKDEFKLDAKKINTRILQNWMIFTKDRQTVNWSTLIEVLRDCKPNIADDVQNAVLALPD